MRFQRLRKVFGRPEPATPHPGDEIQDDLRAAFDADFYRRQCGENVPDHTDLLQHYLDIGWKQGRDPAPWFSTSAYLAGNPDVELAGINPLAHFVQYGRREGRVAGIARMPEAPATPEHCGPESAADEAARIAETIAPHFDAGFYLAVNPDVAEAGQDPVLHYVNQGWREGRDPTRGFSTSYYLDSSPDVRAEGLNPFWHFIVAGREENRLPAEPGGYKAQILKALVPLEQTVESWCKARRDSARADAQELAEVLKRTLRRGSGRLLVGFAHDDYRNNVGGVQLCILREEQAALAAGHSYLSLRPRHPLPRLAAPADAEGLEVEIALNGEEFGWAPLSQLVATVARARSAKTAVSLVVHSLLGHAPEAVAAAAAAWEPDDAWFWLHDNFSICPSYALLRNGITFCGAPGPESQACGICVYGEERARHLPRIRDLFAAVPFTVVAPSESERALWTARSGIAATRCIVQPHLTLDWTGARRRSGAEREGPVRVAFAGIASTVKGWPAYRRLAESAAGLDGLEFHYLGVGEIDSSAITARHVAVTSARRMAMRDALIDIGADLVVIWSACPETFSFTAYEALAAGAAIITHPGTGNVAALVRETGRGRILDGDAQLAEFFANGEARTLAEGNRLKAERGASFILGRMTIDLIEEERADGGALLHELHV
ncbi:MAG TPA: hypothetical protein VLA52_02610 [Thermohalobaculum sp.]|nr:hypothetical protein [Thermohalobaculum sp.]